MAKYVLSVEKANSYLTLEELKKDPLWNYLLKRKVFSSSGGDVLVEGKHVYFSPDKIAAILALSKDENSYYGLFWVDEKYLYVTAMKNCDCCNEVCCGIWSDLVLCESELQLSMYINDSIAKKLGIQILKFQTKQELAEQGIIVID